MKILRLLFSRMFLLVLLILLQIAIVYVVVKLVMDNKYVGLGFYIAFCVLSLILFLSIINNHNVPEIKIAWVTFVLGLPILGILCFIFFSNRGIRKRTRRELEIIDKALIPYYDSGEDWKSLLGPEDEQYVGIFKYLQSVNYIVPKGGNKITYFKNGEEFFPDLIKRLKEAQEFILMEFFIVSYGKEWSQIYEVLCDRAKHGVRVKFIYDDFGCSSTLKLDFVRKMREQGIECCRFNPFVPVLSGAFNNRDHRKICVIDHKYGYTGGINLADEYANDIVRFGYWKDSMVRIEGPAIKNLIMLFVAIFDSSYHSISDYKTMFGKEIPVRGNEIAMPFGDGPIPYSFHNIGEQTFINLFAAAKKTIYISTPYLIPTFVLNEALKNAALRGIDVRLVVPGIPDKKIVYLMAKNNFSQLLKAGVKIYTYTPGFNHEKEVIVDGKIAFIGTINVDYRSLVHHFECGSIIYKSKCIKDMVKSFEETMSQSELVPVNFKLPFIKQVFCSIANLFAPLL